MREVNLALRFLLELYALGALAYWGTQSGSGWTSFALAAAAVLLAAVVWGVFAAPKASHRLSLWPRTGVQAAVFGAAAVALWLSGQAVMAVVFAVAAVVNGGLVIAWGQ